VGRHIFQQAIAAGHEVTVVARNPDSLTGAARTVRADLSSADPELLQSAVKGADAVLSALGARTIADAGIALRGTQAIVDAMKAVGSRRIVVVSASPLSTLPSPGRPNPPKYDPGEGFMMRHVLGPITKFFLRKVYADLALMEDLLRASDLDWTIARPPRLTNGRLSVKYRTALEQSLPGGMSISRADTAHMMLSVLQRPETVRHAVGVAS
jgi:putative NADH-flavin reductase